MGFLDDLKARSAELRGKAEKSISTNSEKIDAGLDKAADAARRATKGKYDDQIGKATQKAKERVDKFGDDDIGGTGSGGGGATH